MNGACLVAQMVKNLPEVQETRVQSLDQEDPLEEGMATHSSILAWRILWTEESGHKESDKTEMTSTNADTFRAEASSELAHL